MSVPEQPVTAAPNRAGRFWLVAMTVVVLVAFVASRLASSSPDGLDRVVQDRGLVARSAPDNADQAPLAGYATAGVEDSGPTKGLAGILGTLAVAVIAAGAGWVAMLASRGAAGRGARRRHGDASP